MEWAEAVEGNFYFKFLDFWTPQAERFYVMLECEMFSVGPVPECGVPSWDMCYMELFTQSVNNRAAAPH